jgi:hypothetical protein
MLLTASCMELDIQAFILYGLYDVYISFTLIYFMGNFAYSN